VCYVTEIQHFKTSERVKTFSVRTLAFNTSNIKMVEIQLLWKLNTNSKISRNAAIIKGVFTVRSTLERVYHKDKMNTNAHKVIFINCIINSIRTLNWANT
jgi:hypothetical protein